MPRRKNSVLFPVGRPSYSSVRPTESELSPRSVKRRRRLRCLFSTVGGALGGAVLGLQAGAGFAEVMIPGGSTLSRLLISLALALLGGLGGAASGAVLSCFGRRD